jgi:predicted DNA-binding transcriptional regulator AlpA
MGHKQYSELTDGDGKFEKWERLPTRAGERLQGMSRATIYNLIDAGLVKSASCKQPGKLTGIRVIWLPSLMDYIEKHTVQPSGGVA